MSNKIFYTRNIYLYIYIILLGLTTGDNRKNPVIYKTRIKRKIL